MVYINWKITDNLAEVQIDDVIYGGFELCINNHSVGFCPQRDLFPGEEWFENIQYAILELAEAAIRVSENQEYKIALLSTNLLRLDFYPGELLEINCIFTENEVTEWSEIVTYDEFYKEIYKCLKEFLAYIKLRNKSLLKSKFIKDISIKGEKISKLLRG